MGGGICNEGENLLSPLRKRVNRFKYAGGLLPDQRIEAAKLGNDAGLIGAGSVGQVKFAFAEISGIIP